MARVMVKFFTTLRQLTGEKQTEVRGATVARIAEKLVEKYGFRFWGTPLNKETGRISFREDLDKEVKDGDVIAIFPPDGGGL